MARDLRPVYTAVNEADARPASRSSRPVGRQVSGDPITLEERRPSSCRSSTTPGDPPGDLLDERHRVAVRPVPASHPSWRTFHERAGRVEVPVPGRAITRPERYPAMNTGCTAGSPPSTPSTSPSKAASSETLRSPTTMSSQISCAKRSDSPVPAGVGEDVNDRRSI